MLETLTVLEIINDIFYGVFVVPKMGNGFASTYKCHTNEKRVLNYNKIWCRIIQYGKRLDNALIRLDK